ncbi:MAG: hypothetical protein KKD92_00810 [Proteobacteria bacterium]|nr:hypothetical protein [Pseudomonadota bacterium]
MKKTVLLLCLIALFVSGCGDLLNMRKISVDPRISIENMQKSSLKAGLLLNEQFTNYEYVFDSGPVKLYLVKNIHGEIEIGKNLSHAIYRIVSSKFGRVFIARNGSEMYDVDLYFVPRIKSYTFKPARHGYDSFSSTMELETEIFDKNGRLLRSFSVKQEGSRNVMANSLMNRTLQEMASGTVNEVIDKTLQEFVTKLNEFY